MVDESAVRFSWKINWTWNLQEQAFEDSDLSVKVPGTFVSFPFVARPFCSQSSPYIKMNLVFQNWLLVFAAARNNWFSKGKNSLFILLRFVLLVLFVTFVFLLLSFFFPPFDSASLFQIITVWIGKWQKNNSMRKPLSISENWKLWPFECDVTTYQSFRCHFHCVLSLLLLEWRHHRHLCCQATCRHVQNLSFPPCKQQRRLSMSRPRRVLSRSYDYLCGGMKRLPREKAPTFCGGNICGRHRISHVSWLLFSGSSCFQEWHNFEMVGHVISWN